MTFEKIYIILCLKRSYESVTERGVFRGMSIRDEEIEVYEDELTPDEIEIVKQVGSVEKRVKSKNYDSEIRRATKSILNSVVTVNDMSMTIGEKLAMKTVNEALKNPNSSKLLDLMKVTGEYTEKTEVKVDNMAEIIKTLQSDSKF